MDPRSKAPQGLVGEPHDRRPQMLRVRFEFFEFVDILLRKIGRASKKSTPQAGWWPLSFVDLLYAAASFVVEQHRSIQFSRLRFAERKI